MGCMKDLAELTYDRHLSCSALQLLFIAVIMQQISSYGVREVVACRQTWRAVSFRRSDILIIPQHVEDPTA